jgi:ferritin-like metal-binding protein YciE
MKLESVQDLFLAELRDLHDTEEQLVKALPKSEMRLLEKKTAPEND